MTSEQWAEIAQRMVAWWPHYDWQAAHVSGSLAQWGADVADLDGDQVAATVEALYRDGREWPPNGAHIRAQLVSLSIDAPEWGDVAAAIRRALSYPESAYRGGQLVHPRAERLAGEHELVAAFVERVGWQEAQWAASADRVAEAQVREKWAAFLRRLGRDITYAGIQSAGLRALERANSEPRQIGQALRAALPKASGQEAA